MNQHSTHHGTRPPHPAPPPVAAASDPPDDHLHGAHHDDEPGRARPATVDAAGERRRLNRLAVSATLHCLTGCAIGEVLGMVIGTSLGWTDLQTIALAVTLAFLFGYSLTVVPVLRARLAFRAAVGVALAADTLRSPSWRSSTTRSCSPSREPWTPG